jgi:hypothetical protein
LGEAVLAKQLLLLGDALLAILELLLELTLLPSARLPLYGVALVQLRLVPGDTLLVERGIGPGLIGFGYIVTLARRTTVWGRGASRPRRRTTAERSSGGHGQQRRGRTICLIDGRAENQQ